MVYINLKVVAASEQDIKDFLQLCSVIQYLGDIGSNRKIEVVVDGDGSGGYGFYLNEERLIPPKDIDADNLPQVYLGE